MDTVNRNPIMGNNNNHTIHNNTFLAAHSLFHPSTYSTSNVVSLSIN